MAHSTHAPQAEAHGLRPRQYVMIGLALTVITAVELWISYSGMPDGLMIFTLVVLSAIKFATVVAFFMHLRFEHSLMARLFAGSLLLATLVAITLVALFWLDLQAVAGIVTEAGH